MKEIFNRIEYKFILDEVKFKRLVDSIKYKLLIDPYCGTPENTKLYSIGSIYYDTYDNIFHNEKLTKQPFRQKLRLRTYGEEGLDTNAFLEIKKNYKGIINKRRTFMKLEDAYKVLVPHEGVRDFKDMDASNHQVFNEICYLVDSLQLEPRMMISYDRLAFRGIKNRDLRITFDNNLRVRYDDLKLENGYYGDLFVDKGIYICEVKVEKAIPVWLSTILSDLGLFHQSFSKHSTCMSRLTHEHFSLEESRCLIS